MWSDDGIHEQLLRARATAIGSFGDQTLCGPIVRAAPRYYEAVMRLPRNPLFCEHDFGGSFRTDWQPTWRPKTHDNRTWWRSRGDSSTCLFTRCSAIIGTYGSSFSGIASLAGQRPVLMLKTKPHIPAGWPSFSRWRWLWAQRHIFVEATTWRRWFIYVVRPQVASRLQPLVRLVR
jgi:hypothetical protein